MAGATESTARNPFHRRFVAHIDIHADVATGWRVLTDLASYPEWNPLLRQVRGGTTRGSILRLRVAKRLGADDTAPLLARVRARMPESELAWGGGIPGLLDVHHFFRFRPLPDSQGTRGFRFIHGEIFRGALLPLLWPIVGPRIVTDNYVAVNEAFKARCEREP